MRKTEVIVDQLTKIGSAEDFRERSLLRADELEKKIIALCVKYKFQVYIERDDRGERPYIGIRLVAPEKQAWIRRIEQKGRKTEPEQLCP